MTAHHMAPTKQAEVISFGCRLNIAESESIAAMLNEHMPDAPLVVVNSCGVTAQAVRTTRNAIRKAARERPGARIIVTGCAAQIDPETFANMPQVARVIGNAEKRELKHYVPTTLADPRIMVSDIMALTRSAPQLLPAFDRHTRAFLEVQNGCDHRCTFCIIPFGRGPSRSVPVAEIVAAAQAVVASGHREIVLTGVDLTSFGDDLPDQPTLADLCRRLLNDVVGLVRLRLGSVDVAEIDDALFDLLTGAPQMMPHVHLSLQSGDDLILKRMKRRHSRVQAVSMVERLKHRRPDIAIGADLIAGFPTEDTAAAANSRALIADCDIVFAHIFPYSVREGTPAARMPQHSQSVVRERAGELREVARAHQQRWLASLIGTRQTLLAERDGASGHIDNFARMRLSQPVGAGKSVDTIVMGLDGTTLIGQVAP